IPDWLGAHGSCSRSLPRYAIPSATVVPGKLSEASTGDGVAGPRSAAGIDAIHARPGDDGRVAGLSTPVRSPDSPDSLPGENVGENPASVRGGTAASGGVSSFAAP